MTEDKRNPLVYSVVIFILACIYLILSVVLVSLMQIHIDSNETNIHYTSPIVALVFSAFILATGITQTVLKRSETVGKANA